MSRITYIAFAVPTSAIWCIVLYQILTTVTQVPFDGFWLETLIFLFGVLPFVLMWRILD